MNGGAVPEALLKARVDLQIFFCEYLLWWVAVMWCGDDPDQSLAVTHACWLHRGRWQHKCVLTLEEKESTLFYLRHGKLTCDSSSNIHTTDNESELGVPNVQDENLQNRKTKVESARETEHITAWRAERLSQTEVLNNVFATAQERFPVSVLVGSWVESVCWRRSSAACVGGWGWSGLSRTGISLFSVLLSTTASTGCPVYSQSRSQPFPIADLPVTGDI